METEADDRTVTQTANSEDEPLNPSLPETRAHLLCFPLSSSPVLWPCLELLLQVRSLKPFEGGTAVTCELSRGKNGTRFCLSVEPWSTSLDCDSRGSHPICATPTDWQGPLKVLSTQGKEGSGQHFSCKAQWTQAQPEAGGHGPGWGWTPACGEQIGKGTKPISLPTRVLSVESTFMSLSNGLVGSLHPPGECLRLVSTQWVFRLPQTAWEL